MIRQVTVVAALLGALGVPARAEARDIGRDTHDSAGTADRQVAHGVGPGRNS